MKSKTPWSKWLGIVYLKVKLGDDDASVSIINAWVDRDLLKHPPTQQELQAAERIKAKLTAQMSKDASQ